MHINWHEFSELSLYQLMAIFKIRQDVFMLEQQSLYEDIDNLDQDSLHLLIVNQNDLLGYGRLRILDEAHVVKLERIVIQQSQRGTGLGVQLIDELVSKGMLLRPDYTLKLSAQTSVQTLYEKWGFEAYGEEFDDGGIPHINMKKRQTKGSHDG